jgi:hypothetical protein
MGETDDEEAGVALRCLRRLAGAALCVLVLAGCSDSGDSSASGESSPSASSSSQSVSPGTATSGDVCDALSEVETAAGRIESDAQGANLAALAGDVASLQSSVQELFRAMSSSAQADVDQVKSAWSDVMSAAAGLDRSDLGQARSVMAEPVGQLRTALQDVGRDMSCS